MTESNEKAIAILNDLVEICEDGEKGFTSAAEGVQDPELKSLFKQYAVEREDFATDLQREVEALGGNPPESGSAAGTLHRGWINLKAAITGKDEHAILAECERGEDAAKEAYEKAIQSSDLPKNALVLIEEQYRDIKEAHDHVRDLRDRVTTA